MTVAVMEVNHTLIRAVAPYWMGFTGDILPKRPSVLRTNGMGEDIEAGVAAFEWSWPELLLDDFLWWDSLLNGAASVTFNHAKLHNYRGALTTYTNAVVHMPTYDKINGDLVSNMKVVIDQLL